MAFDALNKRATYLLEGLAVQWVRQDHPCHVTIRFKNGPELLIGIPRARIKSLDLSVRETDETSVEWVKRAESENTPPPPRR